MFENHKTRQTVFYDNAFLPKLDVAFENDYERVLQRFVVNISLVVSIITCSEYIYCSEYITCSGQRFCSRQCLL